MDRFCRICLNNETTQLFKGFFDKKHRFAESLFYVSNVVVFEISNSSPALICNQCELDLETAVRIKRISLESDDFLRTMTSTADIQLLSNVINNEYEEPEVKEFKIVDQIKKEADDIEKQLRSMDFDPSLIKTEMIDAILGFDDDDNDHVYDEPMIDYEEVQKVLKAVKTPKVKNAPKTPKPKDPTPKEKKKKKFYPRKGFFPCPVEGCTTITKDKHAFKVHMTKHSDERNFACDLCGRTWKTRTSLKVHMETAHGDPNIRYICDVCGGDFGNKLYLRKHLNNHFNRVPAICQSCGKALRDRNQLKNHMLSIHGGGVRNFECPLCQRRFFTKNKLNAHKEFHGDRPWVCQICSKAFTKRYRLGEHMNKVHQRKIENVLTHICLLCGKGYDRAGGLQEHMKVAHDVVVEEEGDS